MPLALNTTVRAVKSSPAALPCPVLDPAEGRGDQVRRRWTKDGKTLRAAPGARVFTSGDELRFR